MADSDRLDALELAVARLTRDLVALRGEIRDRQPGVAGVGEGEGEGDAPLRVGEARAVPRARGAPGVPGAERDVFVSDELRRMADRIPAPAPTPTPPSRWGNRVAGAAPKGDARPGWLPTGRGGIEAFVGRYGTLALAAFTILMGVGAFIGWAIRNGLIGPELRVVLGTLLSGAVALAGWRLRRGDSPRFGSVLLALSLAILHVVCWGAGPLLRLVPDVVALGVATIASAGLAGLALRDEDQSLFNVGFGGALLAPFVTASDAGDPVFLLLYGAIVLVAAMRAMGDREWSKTPFVLGIGIAGYTAAASGQLPSGAPWPRATAPATFAIAMAWLALVIVRGGTKARLAALALVAFLGALGAALPIEGARPVGYLIAGIGVISGYVVGGADPANRWLRFLCAIVLPIGSLAVLLADVGWQARPLAAALAGAWMLASIGAAYINRDGAQSQHAFSAIVFGGMAIVTGLTQQDVPRLMALAAFCGASALVMRRFVLRDAALAILFWLIVGSVGAFALLDGRGRWIDRPFLTLPSAAAAAVCAAWLVFSWNWARTGSAPGEPLVGVRQTVARLLGALVTFAWIHAELSHTISIDVSTFLLVAFYAVSGVVAIGIGRSRSIAVLRQVGLALSVFAAFKALSETASMSIGWKVGGYLLAGGFLLGVAYWYRGRSGAEGAPGAGTSEATGMAGESGS